MLVLAHTDLWGHDGVSSHILQIEDQSNQSTVYFLSANVSNFIKQ